MLRNTLSKNSSKELRNKCKINEEVYYYDIMNNREKVTRHVVFEYLGYGVIYEVKGK